MSCEDRNPGELRIVLLGDGGSGKSATGNTILRKRAFTTRQSQDPETLSCQRERGEFEGTPISVVDTPWTIRHKTTEMSKCIYYCAPGPHVLLAVIPLQAVADVDRHLEILQWLFGVEASRYTIVLFTHGDDLADGVTAEQFIHQNPVPHCVGYHIFNNRDEDPFQVRELLEKINTMVEENGGSYSIKVKDWKDKYLYPLASAATIGSGIGAASGGRGGGGVLMTVVGSAVGAYAANFGDITAVVVGTVDVAVAVAAVGAIVGALAGAGLVAVAGVGFFAVAVVVAVGGAGFLAGVLDGFGAGFVVRVGAGAGALATFNALIDAGVAAAAVGLADALGAGVVTGAGIAAKAIAAIFVGADTAGAAYEMFDDINDDEGCVFTKLAIIGGATVGVGISAALGAYSDGAGFAVEVELGAAGFAVFLGVIAVLSALSDASAFNGITVFTFFALVAGVAVGAAFGAAVGVSRFATGVIISVACQAVTRWLRKKD